MRAIDADALMKRLKAWDTTDATDKALYNFALNRVLEAPTVEPERKTGRWINVRHDNIAECSRCGITGRAWMNFCFDCGADMRTAKYGTKIDLCIMDEVKCLPSAQQEHTKKEDA